MGRSRLAVAVLLLVAGSVGLATAQPDRILVVEDAATGERLVSHPVSDGSTVTLAYTHSVERTPVEDVYTVAGTRLDQTEMRFSSYGWGFPSGADVTTEDGRFTFDPDRSYAELHVKPGRVAGHTLTVDGETYDLVERSDARSVRVAVERRPPIPTFQFRP